MLPILGDFLFTWTLRAQLQAAGLSFVLPLAPEFVVFNGSATPALAALIHESKEVKTLRRAQLEARLQRRTRVRDCLPKERQSATARI